MFWHKKSKKFNLLSISRDSLDKYSMTAIAIAIAIKYSVKATQSINTNSLKNHIY